MAAETNKSAITDHVAKENHVIDWSGAMILDTESQWRTRQLRVNPHMHGGQLNEQRREAYNLPTIYDCILVTCSLSMSRDHMPDEDHRWRTKRRN